MVELKETGPLYIRIALNLKARIETGEFKVGDMLPTETELMEQYPGGRATVRAAVEMLVERGYLIKKQGIGTRVIRPPVEVARHQPLSFAQHMARHNIQPGTRVLSFAIQTPSEIERNKLQLAERESVIQITRLRFADGLPALYEETSLPASLFPGLPRDEVEQQGLYHTLAERYSLLSIHAQERYHPALLPDAVAQQLEIPVQQPCMEIVRMAWRRSDDRVFEYTRAWANSERYPVVFDFISG